LKGGALYIELSGIVIYDVNFTGNQATSSGNDIFMNADSSQTFYHSTTFELCCSFSETVRFALMDNTNLDNLLPHCGSLQGQRYVSSTNSYDSMNTCLNENSPCRSIGLAVSRSVESGEEVVTVVVIGEYDDSATVVNTGIFAHITGVSGEAQSLYNLL
jgi:hypothetical protein